MTEPKIVQKLNARQRKFVREYLKDYNATQAYIRAGYSAKSAPVNGFRLLEHEGVKAAIARKTIKAEKKAEISREEVLATYAQIARATITDVLSFGVRENAGLDQLLKVVRGLPTTPPAVIAALEAAIASETFVTLKNSGDLPPEVRAAISEVSKGKDGSIRVKFHSKTEALAKIGQHFGMFKEIVKHEGEVAVTSGFDMVQEAMARKKARETADKAGLN